MIKELKAAVSQLANGEFLQAFMEPLLFWGLATGTVWFACALWIAKSPKTQAVALLLLVVSSLGVWPVLKWRPKPPPPGAEEAAWTAQSQRRRQHQWVYWTMAGISAGALFLRGKGKLGDFFCVITIAGGLGAAVFSYWMHEKEIRLLHPEAIPDATDPRLSGVWNSAEWGVRSAEWRVSSLSSPESAIFNLQSSMPS